MKKNITTDLSDFLPRIKADIDQRFPIISGFLLIMIVLREIFKIPLSNFLFLLVSLMVLTSIPIALIFDKLRERKPEIAINSYFLYLLLDLIWLTAIIYFVGGISWIAPTFYLFYIITVFWLFPQNRAFILVFYCNFLLFFLVILQYTKILPPLIIFSPEAQTPENLSFLIATTITAIATLSFFGFSADSFYRLLEKKIVELGKTRGKLSEQKKFLEIEVKRETEELEREKEKLEREVGEKTKEVAEKKEIIEKRVKELEKFHKIAIARELKMTEIKEEINKIRESKLKQ